MLVYKKTLANTFELSKQIQDYLQSLEDKKVVIGFSGGPDSVATYHIISDYFLSQGWDTKNIILAHYNHHMRTESNKEAEYIVRNYSNVIVGEFTGIGHKEHILRTARHNFFQSVLKQTGSKTLILGHNLTDRLETTIMNLERGCDYNGVGNMQEIVHKLYLTQDHYVVIRPILDNPKHFITQYCIDHNLTFFIDPSNNDETVSKRNHIRKHLIKPLESENRKPIYEWRKSLGADKKYEEFFYIDLYELFEVLLHEEDLRTGIVSRYNIFFSRSTMNRATCIKKITIPDYFGFDFLYHIESDITIAKIIWILNGIGEGSNITKVYLDNLLRFCKTAQQGHKTLGNWKLETCHGELYLYLTNGKFDAGQAVSYRIQYYEKGSSKHNGTITRLVNLERDYYKEKPINKRLINNKIPSFLRHLVPVKTMPNGEIQYLDTLIITLLHSTLYKS